MRYLKPFNESNKQFFEEALYKAMKYIKPFNESQSMTELVEEIKQFTEESLIELIDNDYKVEFNYSKERRSDIRIRLIKDIVNENFMWDDVKDKMIPFLEILNERYIVASNIHLLDRYFYNSLSSINDFIDDNLPDDIVNNEIINIRIYIEGQREL